VDRENIKPGLWGALGGAIILAFVGFAWGGWVTGGTAQERAEGRAANAVLGRLAPICVEQFKKDSEKDQKLIGLKKEKSWKKSDYVVKQGWATMPGEKKPDSQIAEKCAELIVQLGQ